MDKKNIYKQDLNLSSAFFYGPECMPSSKLMMVMTELKKRIREEMDVYTRDESVKCITLLNIIDSLQLLFTSQDTPLYLVQQSPSVNLLASDFVRHIQLPLKLNELPPKRQEEYKTMAMEHARCVERRDALLNEYITVEKFFRMIDYSMQFDTNCLLGMSTRVRNAMERLSEFNSKVAASYKCMIDQLSTDSDHRVHCVLGKIVEFENFYKESFPVQYENRKGNYKSINLKYSLQQDTVKRKKYNQMTKMDYNKLF